MYKGYRDFTTSSKADDQGLFYQTDDLTNMIYQEKKLKALTRSYVLTYQGEPLNAYFDHTSSRFMSKFNVDLNITTPTKLFLSKEYYYKTDPVVSMNFQPNAGIDATIKNDEPNYHTIKCDKKQGVNDVLSTTDSSDVVEGTLYATEKFDETQLLRFAPTYLSVRTIESAENDISYTSIFVDQNNMNPNYYLSVLGIKSIEENAELHEYCKLQFREEQMKGCYVSSYLLSRNLFRIY